MKKKVRCSFCGKLSDDSTVELMVQGESGAICNSCINLCNDLIFKEKLKRQVEEFMKDIIKQRSEDEKD